jgi:hypothetical protein
MLFKAILESWVFNAVKTGVDTYNNGGNFFGGFVYGLFGSPSFSVNMNFGNGSDPTVGPRPEPKIGDIQYSGEGYAGVDLSNLPWVDEYGNPINNTSSPDVTLVDWQLPDYGAWKSFEMQLSQALGGVSKNTQIVAGRIVDFLTKTGEAWEAKSGQYVWNSRQIQDFLRIYKDKFNLVINATTRYSKPLLEAIEQRGASLWRMVNGALKEIDVEATLKQGQEIMKDAEPYIQEGEQFLESTI